MTLEEAIKHAEEVAEEKFNNAVYIMDKMKSAVALENAEECKRCADEHKQLAEWLKELKQLREQTRWIPVSEKLPEESANVLICDIDGDVYIAYMRNTIYANRIAWSDASSFDNIKNVIAWMPLPKPYEPQESEE